jgi:FtsP/CotA-like multicopper oxidase with cupredoxin domain
MNRRDFIKLSAAAGAGAYLSTNFSFIRRALAAPLVPGLSEPTLQPKFVNPAPNALDPLFKYAGTTIGVGEMQQMTGLVAPDGVTPVSTNLWGYGEGGVYTWPGMTFEVTRNSTPYTVTWNNELVKKNGNPLKHLLPVDESLHWCYSLPGYEQYSIKNDGVPIITHLHGGHSDFQFDGNPEFFYTPGNVIQGPQWANAPGGFTNTFTYDIDVPAGNLWYHDHALGLTRLNVYAGMAGFFFVRDGADSGLPGNSLGLPAYPYELAYAIQDRMFKDDGNLFYPARPGDPAWADFITALGLSDGAVPKPSALAEFFGDHMVVNGKIWPVAATDNVPGVEPRKYRMRLLNGCDSRFMVLQFQVAASPTSTDLVGASAPLPFWVIGSDQGLGTYTETDTLVFEPGGRYDIIFDFSQVPEGSRVIMANYGGDAPYGGGIPGAGPYTETDRIMAFDVTLAKNTAVPDDFDPANLPNYGGVSPDATRTRKVALFEGMDEYGRLQPLLGTAEDATDYAGAPINYMAGDPNAPAQINGAIAWHSPTTENPAIDATEIWEIYNATVDAHPIHLHLVNFQILGRQTFTAIPELIPVLQHNGTLGSGARLTNIVPGDVVSTPVGHFEDAPKDMVTALPGQVTRIKTTFDKPGRYVWHCHILSHEDHEMMRVLQVGPMPAAATQQTEAPAAPSGGKLKSQ